MTRIFKVFNDFAGNVKSVATQSKDRIKSIDLMSMIKDSVKSINELIAKFKDLKKTNFDLGMYYFEKGMLSDAVFRFKLIRFFYPEIKSANYYIARCYVEGLQFKKAIYYLEEYIKSGDKEFAIEADYCKRLIFSPASISKIPEAIITRVYDQLSEIYEDLYLKDSSPQLELFDKVYNHFQLQSRAKDLKVLDLGVGTGYFGLIAKESGLASRITGIDLSPKMIDLAKKLRVAHLSVYNEIYKVGMFEFFAKNKERDYDLVVASMILNYVTDLDGFFKNAHELSSNTSVLAVLFKKSDGKSMYSFSERFEEFLHNPEFIKSSAIVNNFFILSQQEVRFIDGDSGEIVLFSKDKSQLQN